MAGRMTTEQLADYLNSLLPKLVGIFNQRNEQYSTTGLGTSNFVRNAKYNEVFRIHKIIDKSYGVSVHYVLQKIDRLVGGMIMCECFPGLTWQKTMNDSIDDAIIYLMLTKALLKEEGLIV